MKQRVEVLEAFVACLTQGFRLVNPVPKTILYFAWSASFQQMTPLLASPMTSGFGSHFLPLSPKTMKDPKMDKT